LRRLGQFYDYSARNPGSQYYYPSQPLMWNPAAGSPMLTPQLAAAVPATLSDKKRELQVSQPSPAPGFN
jgi:hypothetical protein